jgi:hypothetical protein
VFILFFIVYDDVLLVDPDVLAEMVYDNVLAAGEVEEEEHKPDEEGVAARNMLALV